MLPNGDLWGVVAGILGQRSFAATAITKVRAHAGREEVAKGLVEPSWVEGNSMADQAAKQAAAARADGL
eukprot:14814021-Alexandrium_andersonii.AAC.1